jgi:hypothetical protein
MAVTAAAGEARIRHGVREVAVHQQSIAPFARGEAHRLRGLGGQPPFRSAFHSPRRLRASPRRAGCGLLQSRQLGVEPVIRLLLSRVAGALIAGNAATPSRWGIGLSRISPEAKRAALFSPCKWAPAVAVRADAKTFMGDRRCACLRGADGCDVDAPRHHPVWLVAPPNARGASSGLLRRTFC